MTITKREKEMLDWLQEGKTSWEIAKILGISENTVNFHIKNILKKFDAANRTHLISIALQKGFVGTENS